MGHGFNTLRTTVNFADEHQIFRSAIRRFVQDEIAPEVDEWEENEELPRQLFRRMGEMGFLGIQYPQ